MFFLDKFLDNAGYKYQPNDVQGSFIFLIVITRFVLVLDAYTQVIFVPSSEEDFKHLSAAYKSLEKGGLISVRLSGNFIACFVHLPL